MLFRTSLFLDFATLAWLPRVTNLINDKDFSSQCPLLLEAKSEINTSDEIKPKSAGHVMQETVIWAFSRIQEPVAAREAR